MINEFYNKDNMEGLKELEANSIDCLVTDPPYGYSFMNKGWDKVLPPIATWKECLRVLKPGAFAFVMSAPRQDVLSRMIINLEDAGFKTGFTSIYWTYASGFPKAGNIGKMVDKKLGVERETIKQPYSSQQLNCKDGQNERPWMKKAKENGFHEVAGNIPISEEAKILDGSYTGFQPKPAVEIIIVAMKPLDQPTYIDQALNNGKGITWLDDCRVPYQSDDRPTMDRSNFAVDSNNDYIGNDYGKYKGGTEFEAHNNGRFPANLLVSNDMLNDNKNHKSGDLTGQFGTKNNVYGKYKKEIPQYHNGDEGSFSRFFDLDSWWQKNLKDLPYEAQKTFPWLIVPKASSGEKNEGLDNFEIKEISDGRNSGHAMGIEGKGKQPSRNVHPTVKPLKLISYLITLGSQPNDIILDPYGGSGTTGIAAYRLKRQFILFESEPEYHEIAEARLQNEKKQEGGFEKW